MAMNKLLSADMITKEALSILHQNIGLSAINMAMKGKWIVDMGPEVNEMHRAPVRQRMAEQGRAIGSIRAMSLAGMPVKMYEERLPECTILEPGGVFAFNICYYSASSFSQKENYLEKLNEFITKACVRLACSIEDLAQYIHVGRDEKLPESFVQKILDTRYSDPDGMYKLAFSEKQLGQEYNINSDTVDYHFRVALEKVS